MSSEATLPLTGHCGCGAVQFEIDKPFVGAAYCHCTRCQRRTGTASQASAKIEPGSLKLTCGEEHLRDWIPPGGRARTFCGECGSAVFSRDPDTKEISIVRLGTIDGDPGIRPMAHQFVAYAAAWEPIPDDGLPRFDERIPGDLRTKMSTTEPAVPFGNYQYEIYLQGLSDQKPALPIDYAELEARAKEKLAPEAYEYVAGGAGEGHSMRFNREAFDRWRILPRMLGDVSRRDLSVQIADTHLKAPIVLGPVGVLSIIHPEAELAVARAAAQTGVPMCLSTAASSTLEDVKENLGDTPGWYQLYWPNDPELAASLVQRAEAAGYEAIVITLDTRLLAWRPRDLAGAYLPFLRGEGIANYTSDPVFRSKLEKPPEEDMQAAIGQWAMVFPNPALSWDDLPTLREHTELPIFVKGVLHPDDARRSVDLGLDGVIVSSHGGRQVDGSVTPLGQLPAVVEEVGGEVPVMVDSGVRTGSDVLKAVALGASAVLVARPWIWGLALGGQEGVKAVVRGLLADTDLTMAGCGKSRIADVGPDLLVPAPY